MLLVRYVPYTENRRPRDEPLPLQQPGSANEAKLSRVDPHATNLRLGRLAIGRVSSRRYPWRRRYQDGLKWLAHWRRTSSSGPRITATAVAATPATRVRGHRVAVGIVIPPAAVRVRIATKTTVDQRHHDDEKPEDRSENGTKLFVGEHRATRGCLSRSSGWWWRRRWFEGRGGEVVEHPSSEGDQGGNGRGCPGESLGDNAGRCHLALFDEGHGSVVAQFSSDRDCGSKKWAQWFRVSGGGGGGF
jgi:hypothetical protein